MSTTTTGSKTVAASLARAGFNSSTDPHDILGVANSARPALIKAAFKELAAKYHPIHYLDPVQTHEIILDLSAALSSVDLADFIKHSDRGPTGYLFAGWATPSIEAVRGENDEWQAIVTRWNQIQWAYAVLSKEGGKVRK